MIDHIKRFLPHYSLLAILYFPVIFIYTPYPENTNNFVNEAALTNDVLTNEIESKSMPSVLRNFGDLETKFKTEIEEPALRSSKFARKGQSFNTGRFSLSPGGSSGNAGKGVTRGRFRLFAGGGGSGGGGGGGGGAGSLYIRGIGKRNVISRF